LSPVKDVPSNPQCRTVGPTLSLSSPTACARCREMKYVLGGIASPEGKPASGWLEAVPTLDDSLPGLPTLQKRAAAGCEFCGFLHRVVMAEIQRITRNHQMAEEMHHNDQAEQMVTIRFVDAVAIPAMVGLSMRPEGHFSAAISIQLPGEGKHVVGFDAFTHIGKVVSCK